MFVRYVEWIEQYELADLQQVASCVNAKYYAKPLCI